MAQPAFQRHPARFWEQGEWDSAFCRICPQLCSIAPSRSGACGVRSNRGGTLFVDNYGKAARLEIAESAELPLLRFEPDAHWLLIGMKGCTMRCPFCNTFAFSQTGGARAQPLSVAEAVERAAEAGARGISFGINEPAVSHEFVVDVFRAAGGPGLLRHAATSGAWCEEPFDELLSCVDALTFGIKGFDPAFLQAECGGDLGFIRLNAETAAARGVHVEATYLVLDEAAAGVGRDWRGEARAFAEWWAAMPGRPPAMLLAAEPAFAWRTATDPESMREALAIVEAEGVPAYAKGAGFERLDTHCGECGAVVVRRGAAGTMVRGRTECPNCGAPAPLRFASGQ